MAQVKLLQKEIGTDGSNPLGNINDGDGVPFSANLDITLKKVKVEKTKVFTSATKPLLLPCEVEEFNQTKNITLMFKTGDDMR